jgi:RNA polymerase sigma-70 factor, ECF subfamily
VSREAPSTSATHDSESRRFVQQLRPGHPRHDEAVAKLHGVLLRVAFHELGRRRGQVGSVAGPEFDDLAQQAADDALVSVLRRIDDFEGRSRFTTWAYKFVMFEVSSKTARHAWRRQPPTSDDPAWEDLPDWLAARPADDFEQREQLELLRAALSDLTERQREVFAAIALNDVSIDVLAVRLGTNRNAVYKNLFDARRTLRRQLAAAGYPLTEEDVVQ